MEIKKNITIIPCDLNLAYYYVMGKVKYTSYNRTSERIVWYNENQKVASYNKEKELLYIY